LPLDFAAARSASDAAPVGGALLEVFLAALAAGLDAGVDAGGAAAGGAWDAGEPAEAGDGRAAFISCADFLLLLLFLVDAVEPSSVPPGLDSAGAAALVSLGACFLLLFLDVPAAPSKAPDLLASLAELELFLLFFELLSAVAVPAGSSPLAAASVDFFFELFFEVELPDVSALGSDFGCLDLEDFVVAPEVAAWSDAEALDFDFWEAFLLVFASALWSGVDCRLADAGNADNASRRLKAAGHFVQESGHDDFLSKASQRARMANREVGRILRPPRD